MVRICPILVPTTRLSFSLSIALQQVGSSTVRSRYNVLDQTASTLSLPEVITQSSNPATAIVAFEWAFTDLVQFDPQNTNIEPSSPPTKYFPHDAPTQVMGVPPAPVPLLLLREFPENQNMRNPSLLAVPKEPGSAAQSLRLSEPVFALARRVPLVSQAQTLCSSALSPRKIVLPSGLKHMTATALVFRPSRKAPTVLLDLTSHTNIQGLAPIDPVATIFRSAESVRLIMSSLCLSLVLEGPPPQNFCLRVLKSWTTPMQAAGQTIVLLSTKKRLDRQSYVLQPLQNQTVSYAEGGPFLKGGGFEGATRAPIQGLRAMNSQPPDYSTAQNMSSVISLRSSRPYRSTAASFLPMKLVAWSFWKSLIAMSSLSSSNGEQPIPIKKVTLSLNIQDPLSGKGRGIRLSEMKIGRRDSRWERVALVDDQSGASTIMLRRIVNVYKVEGAQLKKQELPAPMPHVFSTPIRQDIVEFVHTNINRNKIQGHAVNYRAGMKHSAESWGTGRAVARIPRVSGSGTNRSGQGAFGNMCRKGRMFAPIRIWRKWHRRVNLRQKRYAIGSAIAASAVLPFVQARGHKVDKIPELPLVIADGSFSKLEKTKDALTFLKNIRALTDVKKVIENNRVRAGRAKSRNRRIKSRVGPLLVYEGENLGFLRAFRGISGITVCNVNRLNLLQLAPGGHFGRFIIWTESAFRALPKIYSSASKQGYHLPRAVISNPDITKILNAESIHKSFKDPKIYQVLHKKQRGNPLRNHKILDQLNPYEPLRRTVAQKAADAAREARRKAVAEKRSLLTAEQKATKKEHQKQSRGQIKQVIAGLQESYNIANEKYQGIRKLQQV